MTEPLKIALTGRIASGKDSVANVLFTMHDFEYPIAFGTALKRLAHEIFPDVSRVPKPRKLYQFMNVMRDYDPDVWIKHAATSVRVAEQLGGRRGIVITDVRAQNEYEWAVANGFKIVRVSAPLDVRERRIQARGDEFSAEDLEHETEQLADQFTVDYELVNDTEDLAELERKVAEMLEALN